MKVFISHAHADKPIAQALGKLLESMFIDIEVAFSSDDAPDGGPPPGENWRDWIVRQVKEGTHTIAVITPQSADNPWVMWESGAVAGYALGVGKGAESPVIPIVYGMEVGEVPGPMKAMQAVSGEEEAGIRKVLSVLNTSLGQPLGDAQHGPFNITCNGAIPPYLRTLPPPQPYVLSALPLQSKHAIADIYFDKRKEHSPTERRENSIFTASSDAADELFHVKSKFPGKERLVGMPIWDALDALGSLCHKHQFKGVLNEQREIRFDLEDGLPVPAKRPIIFLTGDEADHQNVAKHLQGCAFLPLIIQFDDSENEMKLRVLYYQVPRVPKKEGEYWEFDPDQIPSLDKAVEAARGATP